MSLVQPIGSRPMRRPWRPLAWTTARQACDRTTIRTIAAPSSSTRTAPMSRRSAIWRPTRPGIDGPGRTLTVEPFSRSANSTCIGIPSRAFPAEAGTPETKRTARRIGLWRPGDLKAAVSERLDPRFRGGSIWGNRPGYLTDALSRTRLCPPRRAASAPGGVVRAAPRNYISPIDNNDGARILRYFLMLPLSRLGIFFPFAATTVKSANARRDD